MTYLPALLPALLRAAGQHPLAAASVALDAAGSSAYIIGTVKGPGEPETVSWGVWAAVIGVAVASAAAAGNLAATAYLAAVAAGCFTIGLLAARRGLAWTPQDAACLAAASVALGLLAVVHSPQGAAALTMAADLAGYLPTVSKAWDSPGSEILPAWLLWAAGAACGAAAAGWPSSAAAAWPWYLMVSLSAMALLLIARRAAPGPLRRRGNGLFLACEQCARIYEQAGGPLRRTWPPAGLCAGCASERVLR